MKRDNEIKSATPSDAQSLRQIDKAIDEGARRLNGVPVEAPPSDFVDRLTPPANVRRRRPVPYLALGMATAALALGPAGLMLRSSHASERPIAVRPVAPKSLQALVSPSRPHGATVAMSPKRTPLALASHAKPTSPPQHERVATTNGDREFLNPGRNGVVGGLGSRPSGIVQEEHKDDEFISSRETTFAAVGGNREIHALQQGAEQREQQAKSGDQRLYRTVNLALKHASMEEVCQELARQTGVGMVAARNVRDDNATIFVTNRPARELMREISRVFGFTWERDGDAAHYYYSLRQDAKAQVEEENIRNQDIGKAIQALAAKVKILQDAPDEHPTPNRIPGFDMKDLQDGRSRAADKAFNEMLPDELEKLESGAPVKLSSAARQQEQLDPDVATALLTSMGGVVPVKDSYTGGMSTSPGYTPYTAMKDPEANVTYRLTVTEFGGAKLHADIDVSGIWTQNEKFKDTRVGFGGPKQLAEVSGAAETPVRNASLNADLAHAAGMSKLLQVDPTPTTPVEQQGSDPVPVTDHMDIEMLNGSYKNSQSLQPPRPFITSDDYWQAIHDATGMDVVTDSFSRLFKQRTYKGQLFSVLCDGCDDLHYNWRVDEGFLTGRSTAYVWQRLSEVPKRLLLRWQRRQKKTGYLPLSSLLEMAQLTDRELDSKEVGKAVFNQWKLPEWGLLSRPLFMFSGEPVRPVARFLAALPDVQLEAALENQLPAKAVSPDLLGMLKGIMGVPGEVPADSMMQACYVPEGKFYWSPFFEMGKEPVHTDLIVGNTKEEVLHEVLNRYPDCKELDVNQSDGRLSLTITAGIGNYQAGDGHFGVGWRGPFTP